MQWKRFAGIPNVQAPLSCSGDFVISHRPRQYTVSYRPPGQHHHVGTYETIRAAKAAARRARRTGQTGTKIYPFADDSGQTLPDAANPMKFSRTVGPG